MEFLSARTDFVREGLLLLLVCLDGACEEVDGLRDLVFVRLHLRDVGCGYLGFAV